MPVINSPDFGIFTDAECNGDLLAAVLAFLCIAELERHGYIKGLYAINVDAMEGFYYRCHRLKIPLPSVEDVIGVLRVAVEEAGNPTVETIDAIETLARADGLPNLMLRLEKQP